MRATGWAGIGCLAVLAGGLACQQPGAAPAVSPLPPSPLAIEPAEVFLTTGQATTFKARARDGSAPRLTWSADAGRIDADGRYQAPDAPGGTLVKVQASGGREARAVVTVVPPPRGPVQAPDPVVAGSRGLHASVPDQPGSHYAWTVAGGTLTGGQDRPVVSFDAGTGTTLVLTCRVVNAAGLGHTARLELPLAARIVLAADPKRVTLTAGARRTFGFTLQGGRTGKVVWSVLEAGGGRIDAEGRYQAPASPGSYTVQVAAKEDPTVKDTLAVTVVAPPKGPIQAPPRVAAGAGGLLATVPEQPGCSYRWRAEGGRIETGADAHRVTFAAGAGPKVKLVCEIVNAAGDSLEASLEVPVVVP